MNACRTTAPNSISIFGYNFKNFKPILYGSELQTFDPQTLRRFAPKVTWLEISRLGLYLSLGSLETFSF